MKAARSLLFAALIFATCAPALFAYGQPAFSIMQAGEIERELSAGAPDLMLAQAEKGAGTEKGGPAAGVANEGEYGNVTPEEAAKTPTPEVHVADPLEKWNRAMFTFNDKVYFWVLKPAAKGYGKVVSEPFRVLINNFYYNIKAPIRIINSLLQGKFKYAGENFLALVVNSTVGVGGLRNCAAECFGIRTYDEDFGTTLGFYHVGQGFYVVWPILGPSTARDTAGIVGDLGADPVTWFVPLYPSLGMRTHDRVNYTTFHIGDYEALKKASVDPYVALRSAYIQHRQAAITR